MATQPLKVLIAPLHYTLLDQKSEIRWAYQLVKHMVDQLPQGSEVIVVVGRAETPLEPPKGVSLRVIEVGGEFSGSLVASLQFHLHVSGVIRRLVRTERIDVVHHFLPFALNKTFNPWILSRKPSDPPAIIGSIQAPQTWIEPDGLVTRTIQAVAGAPIRALSWMTLRKAQAIVTMDQTTEATIRKEVGASNIVWRTIFPGTLSDDMKAPQRTKPGSPLQLLTIGHLTPRKGTATCIRAIKELENNGIIAELHHCGEGPELEMLTALAQDLGVSERIHFHGFSNRQTIAELLEKADLYVSGSISEGFAAVYSEALYMGLPIAAVRNIGVEGVVGDCPAAQFCDPGDAAGLAKGITKLANPAAYKELSQKAKDRAKILSWKEVSVPAYIQLYTDLLGRSKSGTL